MDYSFISLITWRIVIDLALTGLLLGLALKFYFNPTSARSLRKMGALEESLRSLLRDADVASRGLNDQLSRRQDSLERLLGSLESMEKRLKISSSKLDEQMERSERVSAERVRTDQNLSVEQPTFLRATNAGGIGQNYQQDQVEPANVIVSEQMKKDQLYNHRADRGVIVEYETEVPQQTRVPLRDKIEKDHLRHVFEKAEQLLKAGKDFAKVAEDTNLPYEQIAILSKFLAEERIKNASSNDARLGVLGKAQTTVNPT